MAGYFKVDKLDFDERWGHEGNGEQYLLLHFLTRRAWWGGAKQTIVNGKPESLGMGQLSFSTSCLAASFGLPQSTFRDRIQKLEDAGEVYRSISANGNRILTVLRMYKYDKKGNRTPCTHRDSPADAAKSVRGSVADKPSLDKRNKNYDNKLKTLKNNRMKATEKYNHIKPAQDAAIKQSVLELAEEILTTDPGMDWNDAYVTALMKICGEKAESESTVHPDINTSSTTNEAMDRHPRLAETTLSTRSVRINRNSTSAERTMLHEDFSNPFKED